MGAHNQNAGFGKLSSRPFDRRIARNLHFLRCGSIGLDNRPRGCVSLSMFIQDGHVGFGIRNGVSDRITWCRHHTLPSNLSEFTPRDWCTSTSHILVVVTSGWSGRYMVKTYPWGGTTGRTNIPIIFMNGVCFIMSSGTTAQHKLLRPKPPCWRGYVLYSVGKQRCRYEKMRLAELRNRSGRTVDT